MALGFEVGVADPEGIGGGADRFAKLLDRPEQIFARVGSIPFGECVCEICPVAPLLSGQTAEVGGRRAIGEASEVDDAQPAPIDEPVPRLPVPMRRDHSHCASMPLGEEPAHGVLDRPFDAVRAVEPGECAVGDPALVVGVEAPCSGVEQRESRAGLPVDVGIELECRSRREHAGQVVEDDDARIPVGVPQRGSETAVDQG